MRIRMTQGVRSGRGALGATVSVALSLFLVACGGVDTRGTTDGQSQSADASQADRNAHLNVGLSLAPPALNPHKMAVSLAAFTYLVPVYDRLTRMADSDGKLEVEPMVATGWEFDSTGEVVTFTLRDGITFSDGAVLDSAAVKATIDHAIDTPGSTVAAYFSMIDSVEAPAPNKVVFRTNRPAADLPNVLAGVEASLISPKALDNPDLDVRPVGSGPYVATDVRIGDSASYERREGYWDSDAQLAETITIKGLLDDNARLNALRSGQVDIANTRPSQQAQLAGLGNGFRTFSYPPAQVYTLFVNNDRPVLSDARVRQALNFAVDREGISTSLFSSQCTPATQVFPEGVSGHLDVLPIEYNYDPDRARELLAEAGVSNLNVNTLHSAGLGPVESIASALRSQFADVGITLNVTPVETSEVTARYSSKSEDSVLQSRAADASPAQTVVRNYLSPRYFPGTTPPALAAALKPAFDPTITEQERTAALEDASRIVNQQSLDVPVCAIPTQMSYTDKVIGADSMGVAHYAGVIDIRTLGLTK